MSNLVVQTNVLALNSHRNLKVIGVKQTQSSARLSSGYRINSAADDAAGLAISEKMRAQIRGLDMASKNTQDGISLVQTAEGGLQEIDNMIQRIRELVDQAANDTNDFVTNDRKKIQEEINQLTQGIDNMSEQVEFNAKKLLDGSLMDKATRSQLLADIDKKLAAAIGVGAKDAYSNAGSLSDVSVNGNEISDATTTGSTASLSHGSLGDLWVENSAGQTQVVETSADNNVNTTTGATCNPSINTTTSATTAATTTTNSAGPGIPVCDSTFVVTTGILSTAASTAYETESTSIASGNDLSDLISTIDFVTDSDGGEINGESDFSDISDHLVDSTGADSAGGTSFTYNSGVASTAASTLPGVTTITDYCIQPGATVPTTSTAQSIAYEASTNTSVASCSFTTSVNTVTVSNVTGTSAGDASYAAMTADVYENDEGLQDYVSEVENYITSIKTARGTDPLTDADMEQITKAQKSIEAAKKLRAGYELVSAQKSAYANMSKIEGDGLWFQTGANSMQGINVGIGSIKTNVLGIGNGYGESTIQVDQASGMDISPYIDVVNDALQYVTAQRAKLGAVQNRMEYTKASLDISSENLSAAESRIRDADMAKEMMKMTAANVLQQAGVSMLSQANQAPQSVLQLLQ